MDNPLSELIAQYIQGLQERKLEAFDKDTAKALKQATAEQSHGIEQVRREARLAKAAEFEPATWLDRAADRANQIALTTHAIKFSHSDAKGSNLNAHIESPDDTVIGTHTLTHPEMDVAGNAAALDVANLLLLSDGQRTLWQALAADDLSPLDAFARDSGQLTRWAAGLKKAISGTGFQTHSLAKQVYWPVDGSYHLLAPLFASSLAHHLWSTVQSHRFDDTAKSAQDTVYLRNLASLTFGGSKPQNVSLLNSRRRGKAYLLPSGPPTWRHTLTAPKTSATFWRQVTRTTQSEVSNLRHFLAATLGRTNRELRQRREDGVAEITTRFFLLVQSLREQEPAGWSRDTTLSVAEQCLLDPTREDEPGTHPEFKFAVDTKSWREEVAATFGRWLNQRLSRLRSADGDTARALGDAEANEWQELITNAIAFARDDLRTLVEHDTQDREYTT